MPITVCALPAPSLPEAAGAAADSGGGGGGGAVARLAATRAVPRAFRCAEAGPCCCAVAGSGGCLRLPGQVIGWYSMLAAAPAVNTAPSFLAPPSSAAAAICWGIYETAKKVLA